MESVLEQFNSFFQGTASAVINDNKLEVTIGSQTLIIALPEVIGGQGQG